MPNPHCFCNSHLAITRELKLLYRHRWVMARGWVLLMLALAVLAVSIESLYSSHTGYEIAFKIFRPTQQGGTGECTQCYNWLALPMHNKFSEYPVKRLSDICLDHPDFQEVALPGLRCIYFNSDFTFTDYGYIDEMCSFNCDNQPGAVANPTFERSRPIRVKLRATSPIDDQYVVVGWHWMGEYVYLMNSPTGGGTAYACTTCANWVTYPYHHTAKRLYDICLESDKFLTVGQPGGATGAGDSTVSEPHKIDLLTIVNCTTFNSSRDPNPLIQTGRPIRVVLKESINGVPVGDYQWRPSHY